LRIFDDEMIASLSITSLPEGFDLIVDGHLHWQNEINEAGRHLILPGSTIITQMKRLESKKPKGFYIMETGTERLEFCALPRQRPFFYEKIEFENATGAEVIAAVKEKLEQLTSGKFEKKPMIKIKLLGSLAKGHSQENIDIKSVLREFEEKAIVSVDSSFFQESFSKRLATLSDLQQQKKSIIELGFNMLEKNLSETNFANAFDVRRVFKLLENGDVEKARELLLSEHSEQGETRAERNEVKVEGKNLQKSEERGKAKSTAPKTLSDFT